MGLLDYKVRLDHRGQPAVQDLLVVLELQDTQDHLDPLEALEQVVWLWAVPDTSLYLEYNCYNSAVPIRPKRLHY